jgi:hypothetical protein
LVPKQRRNRAYRGESNPKCFITMSTIAPDTATDRVVGNRTQYRTFQEVAEDSHSPPIRLGDPCVDVVLLRHVLLSAGIDVHEHHVAHGDVASFDGFVN